MKSVPFFPLLLLCQLFTVVSTCEEESYGQVLSATSFSEPYEVAPEHDQPHNAWDRLLQSSLTKLTSSSLDWDTLRLAFSRRHQKRAQHHQRRSIQYEGGFTRKCRLRSSLESDSDSSGAGDDGNATVITTTATTGVYTWTQTRTFGTGSDGAPLPTQTIGDGHGGGGSEIIAAREPCDLGNIDIPVGATVRPNATTGPNGQIEWLTCGIVQGEDTGWRPPFARLEDVITFPGGLSAAIKVEGSPFQACERFVDLFEEVGAEYQIPPFFIASFALQESTCNPDLEGQGGEQGMMQISEDKCWDAPDGNCRDVVFNVRKAASYFRDVVDANNGNVFEAVGNYNGWQRGMSYYEGTTWGIAHNCCRCQRNLDYLHQFFNGWLQNINVYAAADRMGHFFNLDIC